MRPLSTQKALVAWERGRDARSVSGRALALLRAALPEVEPEQLGDLSLGQRDALLLRLREISYGREIPGSSSCPKCNAPLQFALDTRAYEVDQVLERRFHPETLVVDDHEVLFRVPTSQDFEMMSRAGSVEQARAMLLERCILGARHNGASIAPGDLPEAVVEKVGDRMEELDPLADLPLEIECARCGHGWRILLDPGVMLWQEVDTLARRLLYEVHLLASTYSWHESEILSMSAARRRYYIDLVPRRELD